MKGQGKVVRKDVPDTIPVHFDSLKAVIVTAPGRPKMKGDTLEYNTEHILLQRNAAVEELLRRLPGLHVSPDGTITYNGEKIQKLLVDGEDIFGYDPSIVTRNFDAGKIARVQILDRRSEQTIFSGIDDGTRTKTLNLVLKESAKDGYFGKVEAGGNSDGYFNTNATLAAFRNREQFAFIGIAANNGVVGFSNDKSGATVSYMNVNSDALGASAGTGVPHFDAAALHYANTWTGPVNHLMANYQYSHYYTQPVTETQSQQMLPRYVYGQRKISQSTNRQDQHWFYGTYDWAPNEVSAFRFGFHFSNSDGVNEFGATGNSKFNDTLVNTSAQAIRDQMYRMNIGGGLSWRMQLGKYTDRIFSVSVEATKIDNATNGYLYTVNSFYQPTGLIQSADTTDQRKEISSHNLNIGGSLNYTEPLWKGAILGLTYSISHVADDPLQATYNRGDGKYLDMVDTLSNHFKTQTVRQRVTLNLQGKVGYLSYTIGNDWLRYGYSQRGANDPASLLQLRNFNWAPRVLLNFTPSRTSNLGLSYGASTIQPSATQVTPIKNNNDPLHIALGNPGLKPAFSQNLRLDFRRFKTWLINISLNMRFTSGSISTRTITDSFGRQTTQPVNIDGARSDEVGLSFSRKLLGFDAGFYTNGAYTRTVNYVNTALSFNDAFAVGGGVNIKKYLDRKYSLQLSTNFGYFDQHSSVNVAAPINYWTQTHSGIVSIFLIRGLEVNVNLSYSWQQKSSAFPTSTSVFLWNTYVSRNFLHDKLIGKFQFNNILNTKDGISRSNMENINTQSSTNILGRYWMFSLIYNFDRKFRN